MPRWELVCKQSTQEIERRLFKEVTSQRYCSVDVDLSPHYLGLGYLRSMDAVV